MNQPSPAAFLTSRTLAAPPESSRWGGIIQFLDLPDRKNELRLISFESLPSVANRDHHGCSWWMDLRCERWVNVAIKLAYEVISETQPSAKSDPLACKWCQIFNQFFTVLAKIQHKTRLSIQHVSLGNSSVLNAWLTTIVNWRWKIERPEMCYFSAI